MNLIRNDNTIFMGPYKYSERIVIGGYNDDTAVYESVNDFISLENKWCLGLCSSSRYTNTMIDGERIKVCDECKSIHNSSIPLSSDDYEKGIDEHHSGVYDFIGHVNEEMIYASWCDGNSISYRTLKKSKQQIKCMTREIHCMYKLSDSKYIHHRDFIRRKYIRRLLMFARIDLVKDIIKEIAYILIRI